MNNSTHDIGNSRLVVSDWQTETGVIFAQGARLMSEIVSGQLIHFKTDELFIIVDESCERFRVGIPMIGSLNDKQLETIDLMASQIESVEVPMTLLTQHKLIKNLYDDLGLSKEYFMRISSNQGDYQLFYEKYLIQ